MNMNWMNVNYWGWARDLKRIGDSKRRRGYATGFHMPREFKILEDSRFLH